MLNFLINEIEFYLYKYDKGIIFINFAKAFRRGQTSPPLFSIVCRLCVSDKAMRMMRLYLFIPGGSSLIAGD